MLLRENKKKKKSGIPNDGLNHQVGYVLPDLISVDAFFLKIGPQRLQAPFVSGAGLLVIVGLVVLVGLVDAVVGQVHELVADGLHRVGVLARGEAREAVVEQVDAQRVERRHVHVDAQVELEAVDEIRIGQVLLHNARSLLRYLLHFIYNSDALTARTRRLCI